MSSTETETLDIAKRLSGLEEKYLTPFDATDPFNGELRLQGFLSQRPTTGTALLSSRMWAKSPHRS